MKYIADFEVAALLFLVVVSVHFFGKYKFPSTQNLIFSIIIICGISDIVFDLITVYTIPNSDILPIWINMVANSAYYLFHIMEIPLLYCYVLSIVNLFGFKHKKKILLTLSPFFIFVGMLLLNPVVRCIFYINEDQIFTRGEHFSYLYYSGAFYIIMTLIILNRHRKEMREIEYKTILGCLILMSAAAVTQYIRPQFLLTGLTLSLSVIMVYLTMQNPNDMLDDMTGLFNRGCFLKLIRIKLENKGKFNLIILGLDDTKLINNMFGLSNGNEVMRQVAEFIKSIAGSVPVFRMLGDQFAIVCDESRHCISFVKDIKLRLKSSWIINGNELNLSACICYAVNTECDYTESEMMMLLEHMMTQAKKRGPGTVLEIDDEACRSRQRELEIEAGLREAIGNGSLDVYFQPIYSTKKKSFISAEALVRFRHDKYGWVSPSEFIPLAEKRGLIIKIGELVLEKICEMIQKYKLDSAYDLEFIEINLSAVELMKEHFADELLRTLQRYKVAYSFMNFEITETVATTAHKAVMNNMEILVEKGISFAMDDYGTGYANVDSVIRLPFTIVKIDRSMLVASFDNERSTITLFKTIELMQALNLEIVVEGAETLEQAELLISKKVDYIQGYYYAKPMPITEFIAFLVKNKQSQIT